MPGVIPRLLSVCILGWFLSAAPVKAQTAAATPTFSPAAGVFASGQSVMIGDTTPGAVIHCTLDWSTPTASSPVCSGAIAISKNTTVKAIAVAPGDTASPVATGIYTIRAAEPAYSPAPGVFPAAQPVRLSDTTPGARIYYTLDNTEPSTSSALYAAPITISKDTIVRAVAFAPGYTAALSTAEIYYIRAATPTMNPPPGSYTATHPVTISDTTPGAKIYFTLDNSEPSTNSTLYTGPISVTANTIVNAVAYATGYIPSLSTSAIFYAAQTATPTLTPLPGTYPAVSVNISDTTPWANIYYTVDGTEPTTNSTLYNGPVSITGNTTVKAIALFPGDALSTVASGGYSIPKPPAVTLEVMSGSMPVTLVETGTVVTLTAAVKSGSTAVTLGQVNFCDATAQLCTDIHLLGSASLTSSGTAVLKLRPRLGENSIKAVFTGTSSNGASASAPSTLSVTDGATSTAISLSGKAGNYTVTGTVTGLGSRTPPTGTVTFVDTSNSNSVLGDASVEAGTVAQTFGAAISYPTVDSPSSVVVGDFNRDGIPDLAVINSYNDTGITSTSVSVLLGKGDGTFKAQAPFATGIVPFAIVVEDFNGDGIPDLAVSGASSVAVLLGKGDGTFSAPVDSPVSAGGSLAASMAVGDFNGDGIPDLVVSDNVQGVDVLLGKGDGTFNPAVPYPYYVQWMNRTPVGVLVGDFNRDGVQDFAVLDTTNGIDVFPGIGDGTFGPPLNSNWFNDFPASFTTADFNGDGILDFAVPGTGIYETSGAVEILLGNGDGTFALPVDYSISPLADFIVVADFNGDGASDVAVADCCSHTATDSEGLFVLLNNGDGTFGTAAQYGTDQSTGIAAGDFNGDGVPDLAVATELSTGIGGVANVLLNELTSTATASISGVSAPLGDKVKATYPGDSLYAGSSSATTPVGAAKPSSPPAVSLPPTPVRRSREQP